MNGSLGLFSIKPDQMQLLNPALILLLIPLFDMVIYPAFAKYAHNWMIKQELAFKRTFVQDQLIQEAAAEDRSWRNIGRSRLCLLWIP